MEELNDKPTALSGADAFRRAPGTTDEALSDAWAVWGATLSRLPTTDNLSPALLHGLTGGIARRAKDKLTCGDLDAFAPGLKALGIHATLLPFPPTASECLRLLRSQARWGSIPLFTCPIEEEPPPTDDNHSLFPLPSSLFPLLSQALVRKVGQGSCIERVEVVIQTAAGQSELVSVEELRQRFTHAQTISRASKRGLRRANLQAALGRWVGFAVAFPERSVGDGEEDAPIRALAAQFLRLCAGKRGDRASNRLRYAALHFERCRSSEEIDAAFALLREAVCIGLQLPISVERALLAPVGVPLTDLERRDLIYFARAGAPTLKALAAWRLMYERHHSDAARTLEQLQSENLYALFGLASSHTSV